MRRSVESIRRLHETLHRPAKFAVVGAANTAVDFALFWLLISAVGWRPVLANSFSYSAGLANSYVLNKIWTFRDASRSRKTAHQFVRFAGFNLIGLGISNAIIWTLGPTITPLGAKGVAIFATFIWNYWTSRRFVYLATPN